MAAERELTLVIRARDAASAIMERVTSLVTRLKTSIIGTGQSTDQLSQGFTRGQARLVTFEAALSLLSRGLSLVRELAENSFGALASRAEQIQSASRQFNVPVEQIQALSYAAQQADTDVGALLVGMRTFAVNLQQAREGNEQAIDSFRSIGLGAQDLKRLGDQDLVKSFAEVANRVGGIRNQVVQTTRSFEIFGRGYKDVTATFKETTLDQATQRLQELGIVLDDSVLAKFSLLKNRSKDVALAFEAIVLSVLKQTGALDLAGQGYDKLITFLVSVREGSKTVVAQLLTVGQSIAAAIGPALAQAVADGKSYFAALRAQASALWDVFTKLSGVTSGVLILALKGVSASLASLTLLASLATAGWEALLGSWDDLTGDMEGSATAWAKHAAAMTAASAAQQRILDLAGGTGDFADANKKAGEAADGAAAGVRHAGSAAAGTGEDYAGLTGKARQLQQALAAITSETAQLKNQADAQRTFADQIKNAAAAGATPQQLDAMIRAQDVLLKGLQDRAEAEKRIQELTKQGYDPGPVRAAIEGQLAQKVADDQATAARERANSAASAYASTTLDLQRQVDTLTGKISETESQVQQNLESAIKSGITDPQDLQRIRDLSTELAKVKKEAEGFVNIFDTVKDGVSDVLDAVLFGGRKWKDALSGFAVSFGKQMEQAFFQGLKAKAGFDTKVQVNIFGLVKNLGEVLTGQRGLGSIFDGAWKDAADETKQGAAQIDKLIATAADTAAQKVAASFGQTTREAQGVAQAVANVPAAVTAVAPSIVTRVTPAAGGIVARPSAPRASTPRPAAPPPQASAPVASGPGPVFPQPEPVFADFTALRQSQVPYRPTGGVALATSAQDAGRTFGTAVNTTLDTLFGPVDPQSSAYKFGAQAGAAFRSAVGDTTGTKAVVGPPDQLFQNAAREDFVRSEQEIGRRAREFIDSPTPERASEGALSTLDGFVGHIPGAPIGAAAVRGSGEALVGSLGDATSRAGGAFLGSPSGAFVDDHGPAVAALAQVGAQESQTLTAAVDRVQQASGQMRDTVLKAATDTTATLSQVPAETDRAVTASLTASQEHVFEHATRPLSDLDRQVIAELNTLSDEAERRATTTMSSAERTINASLDTSRQEIAAAAGDVAQPYTEALRGVSQTAKETFTQEVPAAIQTGTASVAQLPAAFEDADAQMTKLAPAAVGVADALQPLPAVADDFAQGMSRLPETLDQVQDGMSRLPDGLVKAEDATQQLTAATVEGVQRTVEMAASGSHDVVAAATNDLAKVGAAAREQIDRTAGQVGPALARAREAVPPPATPTPTGTQPGPFASGYVFPPDAAAEATKTGTAIHDAGTTAAGGLRDASQAAAGLSSLIGAIGPTGQNSAGQAAQAMAGAAQVMAASSSVVQGSWGGFFGWFLSIAQTVLGQVASLFGQILGGAVRGIGGLVQGVGSLLSRLTGIGGGAGGDSGGGILGALGNVGSWVSNLFGDGGSLGGIAGVVKNLFSGTGIGGLFTWAKDLVGSVKGALGPSVTGFVKSIGNIAGTLGGAAIAITGALQVINGKGAGQKLLGGAQVALGASTTFSSAQAAFPAFGAAIQGVHSAAQVAAGVSAPLPIQGSVGLTQFLSDAVSRAGLDFITSGIKAALTPIINAIKDAVVPVIARGLAAIGVNIGAGVGSGVGGAAGVVGATGADASTQAVPVLADSAGQAAGSALAKLAGPVLAWAGALYSIATGIQGIVENTSVLKKVEHGDKAATNLGAIQGISLGAFTGLGALIGTLIYPGIGTAIGAGLGATLATIINAQLTKITAQVVGKATSPARGADAQRIHQGISQDQLGQQLQKGLIDDELLRALSGGYGLPKGLGINTLLTKLLGPLITPNIEHIFNDIFQETISRSLHGRPINRQANEFLGEGASGPRRQAIQAQFGAGGPLREQTKDTAALVSGLIGAGSENESRIHRFFLILSNSLGSSKKSVTEISETLDRIVRNTTGNLQIALGAVNVLFEGGASRTAKTRQEVDLVVGAYRQFLQFPGADEAIRSAQRPTGGVDIVKAKGNLRTAILSEVGAGKADLTTREAEKLGDTFLGVIARVKDAVGSIFDVIPTAQKINEAAPGGPGKVLGGAFVAAVRTELLVQQATGGKAPTAFQAAKLGDPILLAVERLAQKLPSAVNVAAIALEAMAESVNGRAKAMLQATGRASAIAAGIVSQGLPTPPPQELLALGDDLQRRRRRARGLPNVNLPRATERIQAFEIAVGTSRQQAREAGLQDLAQVAGRSELFSAAQAKAQLGTTTFSLEQTANAAQHQHGKQLEQSTQAIGQLTQTAIQQVQSWGQAITSLVDRARQADTALRDFTLSTSLEIAGLRKSTDTAKLYNDVLKDSAERYVKLAYAGSSAAAQLDAVNQQMTLLRQRAQAQIQDIQATAAAKTEAAQTRLDQVAPLGSLAEGIQDQARTLSLAGLTPKRQYAQITSELGQQQSLFASTTGEDQAKAAQKIQSLVTERIAAAGQAFGEGSSRFRQAQREGAATLNAILPVAEAAQKEQTQLLADIKKIDEDAKKAIEKVNTTLANQLELWSQKAVPLLEQQRADLVAQLKEALPGADIEQLLSDPMAAQVFIAGQQLDQLQLIAEATRKLAGLGPAPAPTPLVPPPPTAPTPITVTTPGSATPITGNTGTAAPTGPYATRISATADAIASAARTIPAAVLAYRDTLKAEVGATANRSTTVTDPTVLAAIQDLSRRLSPTTPLATNPTALAIAARATGGPVSAGQHVLGGEHGPELLHGNGQAYLIGTKGPQLFRAPVSGTVIPAPETARMLRDVSRPFPAVTAPQAVRQPGASRLVGQIAATVLATVALGRVASAAPVVLPAAPAAARTVPAIARVLPTPLAPSLRGAPAASVRQASLPLAALRSEGSVPLAALASESRLASRPIASVRAAVGRSESPFAPGLGGVSSVQRLAAVPPAVRAQDDQLRGLPGIGSASNQPRHAREDALPFVRGVRPDRDAEARPSRLLPPPGVLVAHYQPEPRGRVGLLPQLPHAPFDVRLPRRDLVHPARAAIEHGVASTLALTAAPARALRIPAAANGALVLDDTLLRAGEKANAEAVLPLTSPQAMRRVGDAIATGLRAAIPTSDVRRYAANTQALSGMRTALTIAAQKEQTKEATTGALRSGSGTGLRRSEPIVIQQPAPAAKAKTEPSIVIHAPITFAPGSIPPGMTNDEAAELGRSIGNGQRRVIVQTVQRELNARERIG